MAVGEGLWVSAAVQCLWTSALHRCALAAFTAGGIYTGGAGCFRAQGGLVAAGG